MCLDLDGDGLIDLAASEATGAGAVEIHRGGPQGGDHVACDVPLLLAGPPLAAVVYGADLFPAASAER